MTLHIPSGNESGVVHFDPEKFGRLKDAVLVLRKVNINKLQHRANPQADTAWELIGKGQVQLHLYEYQLPWYKDGFIINDNPRDEKVARDIMKATIGFALARSDTGEVIKVYGPSEMQAAYDDAASVTLTIKPILTRLAQTAPDESDDDLVEAFLAEHQNVVDEAPEAEKE